MKFGHSAEYKPAIGYLRRSTDRQEQSIGDQLRVIEGYAANNGYNVFDYYIDDANSGASSEDRASFLRLIQDAKQSDCPFQFVLVYDIKRFGRIDNDEAGYYPYQLRSNGVEIIYVSEGFNGDGTDDLLRPAKQWQARQELKVLSKETIGGLLTHADVPNSLVMWHSISKGSEISNEPNEREPMQAEHRTKSIRPTHAAWRFIRGDGGVMDQEQYNHALGIYARWLVKLAVMQSPGGQPEVTGSAKLCQLSLTSEVFNRTLGSPITVNK